jgi:toxin FitB
MFLLDTDILSELEKPNPNRGVLAWIESVDWLELSLSVITIGEIWKGIAGLPKGRKRQSLEGMFELIPERFFNRIIPIDYAIAVKFGDIQARLGPLPTLDTLIAATALVNRLTLVTHNTKDMERTGVLVFDPWI